jgi:ketopantoate reductase
MKIFVVGAGIIEDIYGWAFAGAGHEVTHLVRSGRAAQYGNGGSPAAVELMDLVEFNRELQARLLGSAA